MHVQRYAKSRNVQTKSTSTNSCGLIPVKMLISKWPKQPKDKTPILCRCQQLYCRDMQSGKCYIYFANDATLTSSVALWGIVQQPSRHFYLNLAKIPPNQVIADFGRVSSVESESERCPAGIIERFELFKMASKMATLAVLKHLFFRKFLSDFIL